MNVGEIKDFLSNIPDDTLLLIKKSADDDYGVEVERMVYVTKDTENNPSVSMITSA